MFSGDRGALPGDGMGLWIDAFGCGPASTPGHSNAFAYKNCLLITAQFAVLLKIKPRRFWVEIPQYLKEIKVTQMAHRFPRCFKNMTFRRKCFLRYETGD